MKKYILSIIILSALLACNQTTTPPDIKPLPDPDSSPAKIDSPVVPVDSDKVTQTNNNLGTGLTQEEMTDDTVFSDGSKPTSWEIAGIIDVKDFKLFLKQVQLLILNNDKEKLAKLVKYPLSKSIKNEIDFINNYDQVFSKDAKLSIARINFSQIFRNSKGVMSEDGKVWFSQEGKEFKIIAINS